MDIGLVIYDSLDTLSGGYLYDRKLVEFLRSQGDAVEIISLPWRGYTRCLGDNFSPVWRSRLAAFSGDLLLQDELNHPSLFLQARWLRNSPPRIAIVHHLRSDEQRPAWQQRLFASLERRYLDSVTAFVFNSQTTARSVNALLNGERPAVIAFPAGDRFKPQISSQEIASRASQPDPLRLVFLGNLIRRKGLHLLLAALARLPAGTAELAVVGSPAADPRYVRRIQRQVDRSGLAGTVCFLGRLADAELALTLRGAHVLVVPSTYEGYGIAYLEGMGFGLPAIAGNRGAAGEIITHDQDGYLLAPDDTLGLAQAIAALAADRARLLELSLAAHRRYLSQPGWEEMGRRIREFLLTLCTPSNATSPQKRASMTAP